MAKRFTHQDDIVEQEFQNLAAEIEGLQLRVDVFANPNQNLFALAGLATTGAPGQILRNISPTPARPKYRWVAQIRPWETGVSYVGGGDYVT